MGFKNSKVADGIEAAIIKAAGKLSKPKQYQISHVDTSHSGLSGSRYIEFELEYDWEAGTRKVSRGKEGGRLVRYDPPKEIPYEGFQESLSFKVRISDHDLPPSYARRNRGEFQFGVGIEGHVGEDTDVSTDDPKTASKEFEKWFNGVLLREI